MPLHGKVITLSWKCTGCKENNSRNQTYDKVTKSRLCHKNVTATTKLCSCHIVMILSSKCLVYWKQTKKATVQEHCSTIGLPKVIILLLKYDNIFCYCFVMKTLMTWPHFLVNTYKTSRLKLLTTASRIPHYRIKLPHWCIRC